MQKPTSNYSRSSESQENVNRDEKYDGTGESEFSRESTIPFDENEVFTERHFNLTSRFHPSADRNYHNGNRSHSVNDFRGKGPKGYQRSDIKIKDQVSEALYRCTQVDATDIEVSVTNGDVILKGTVTDRFQKKWAERTIEHLSGVTDVHNHVTIRNLNEKSNDRGGLIQNTTGIN
ncbi:MAG TPA: BON domain-containing protein [Bacteriovoracaceae bacterium]|nr:BON domain-containing protein [Bacteriovoracaceae bacterium]